jgi:hypothetical protein
MYRQISTSQAFGMVHVMDFDSKAVRNFVRFCIQGQPNDPSWYYGASDGTPGKPYCISLGEMI